MSGIELEPCPFCGGNPEFEEAEIRGFWHVRCENENCIAGADWCIFWDREKLAGAWNTRAERTCSVESSRHDVDGSWHYLTCGHRADTWLEAPPNYCPVCGAKVVDE